MKKALLVLLVISFFLATPIFAFAGGCRSNVIVSKNVSIVDVITPVAVAVPVIIPAFQFQYVPPPCAPQVVGNPQHGNDNQFSSERLKALAKALVEEMKKEEQLADAPPMAFGGPVASPAVAPGHSVNFLSSLSIACAECHTNPQAKGGVIIFQSPGVLSPLAPKAKILDALNKGRMPPPNASYRPNASEIESIKQWAAGL